MGSLEILRLVWVAEVRLPRMALHLQNTSQQMISAHPPACVGSFCCQSEDSVAIFHKGLDRDRCVAQCGTMVIVQLQQYVEQPAAGLLESMSIYEFEAKNAR